MGRIILACGGVLLPVAAAAQQPAAQPIGTPSAATATVSPVTVLNAASREEGRATNSTVSLGTSYAGGDFGTAKNTSILNTALGARVQIGDLRLLASIPYMRVRSAGIIYTGIDSTPIVVSGDRGGARRTADGIGDLTLGGTYTLAPSGSTTDVEFSARVKVPTAAKSDNLSTRRTDVSVGAQVTKTLGRAAPFLSVAYRWFGDPKGLDLRNGVAASVGTSFSLGERTVLLGSYHFAQTASRFVPDSHEVFLGGSRTLGSGRLRLTSFATAGLSHGAAAASGGLGVSLAI